MTAAPETSLTLRAPGKVNLCLSVRYPPRDGFHELDSVFQALDVADVLTFSVCDEAPDGVEAPELTRAGTPVSLSCEGAGVATRDNLVFKAVDAAEAACARAMVPAGSVLRVDVEKHVPAGGGMGGGSSDAACALEAYARLTGLDALSEPLSGVARKLGADVAFFLYGGAALMTGRGDELVRRLPAFPLPLVLMGDEHGNPTPKVYAAFDAHPAPAPSASALAEAMERGASPEELASLCANNLGPAACELNPSLAMRLERASRDPDVLCALVSGSGSTCFAVCADEASARSFASRAREFGAWVEIARAEGR